MLFGAFFWVKTHKQIIEKSSSLDFISAQKHAVYFSCIYNQCVCVKEWGAKLKKKKRETRLYVGEIFMCQTVVTLRE